MTLIMFMMFRGIFGKAKTIDLRGVFGAIQLIRNLTMLKLETR